MCSSTLRVLLSAALLVLMVTPARGAGENATPAPPAPPAAKAESSLPRTSAQPSALAPSGNKQKKGSCTFTVYETPTALIRGAREESFALNPSPTQCTLAALGLKTESAISLVDAQNPTVILYGKVAWDGSPGAAKNPNVITVSPVPADLSLGARTWYLRDGANQRVSESPISIPVTEIRNDSTLLVHYDNAVLDRLQSGRASTGNQGASIAVVNGAAPLSSNDPAASSKDRAAWLAVSNVATLTVPPDMPPAPSGSAGWYVAGPTWGDAVRVLAAEETCRDGECELADLSRTIPSACLGNTRCLLADVSRVTFSVKERRGDPLRVRLLYKDKPYREKPGGPDFSGFVWLDTSVTLAGEARVESIPLPVANALRAGCADEFGPRDDPEKKVGNGVTRAIDDSALRDGACSIYFYPRLLEKLERDLPLFGPQTLDVVVHRDGSGADGHVLWTTSVDNAPSSAPDQAGADAPPEPRSNVSSLTLPPPATDTNGNGPYVITVRTSRTGTQAIYRDGTTPAGSLSDTATAPEYVYSARLRPRGPFGFRKNVRMFVTIPVDITGIRFPASPRDLARSSQNPSWQATSVRTGILFGVEPWNYNSGRNRFPLPVRALAGFNLVNITQTSFEPTFVIGGSVTAPILDNQSQVGTSIGLGAFYELDLRDRHPFSTGNRFLVTFGFNVFTLFGAK